MPPTHPSADTIVAVSSPPGRSYRGLIRLSGDTTRQILNTLIADQDKPSSARVQSTVQLKSPDMPALLLRFDAPHSYTGQDMAELQVPGHPALLDRLLQKALKAGARLAEPGEFTFRAFLAGRLDLTQAEGVAATINAVSDTQLRAARHLLDGELGGVARSLVDDLGTLLALVEAGIDFTDQEDVVPIGPGELDGRLAVIESRLKNLLANSRSWSEVEALPWVVLVGAPSAGKSTLFNALLGRERAVIDPEPGTTRDVLCEPVMLKADDGTSREFMLVDVAGLDDVQSRLATPLDAESQAAAKQAIQRADLILNVVDPTRPVHLVKRTVLNTPTLTVYSKADLTDKSPDDGTRVSATDGRGQVALRDAIARQLGDLAVSVNAEMLALQPRHEASLRSAAQAVGDARYRLSSQHDAHAIEDVEMIAAGLRQALNDLAALGGQLTPDDVIGRVFATFCVGK